MADFNQRMPRIDSSRFSMVPSSDVPRSTFVTTHSLKSTFDAGYLIPIYVGEVIPGDTFQGRVTIFSRITTPIFPIMDRIEVETFFFFVPNRLVWSNWVKMMGERKNPADSISFTTPQITSPASGWAVGSIYDYMGLPTVGQIAGGATKSVNALPLRAYALIYDEWFRDQNLQNAMFTTSLLGDGPDPTATYFLLRRNKKHDYFTSALPWPLKGGVDVTLPLSGTAPITGLAVPSGSAATAGNPASSLGTTGGAVSGWLGYWDSNAVAMRIRAAGSGAGQAPQIYADLSQATGATINALRLAVQTQKLLERDARGGTRYTELIHSHFRVSPEDVRLQRPEYIGGGRTDVQTSAVPQTSATSITGSGTALGSLGAAAVAADQHSFHYNATEHGFILGLANVRAELTYQQGVARMWTRQTRLDHYWPVFAHLGEQAIRTDEIYATGTGNDLTVFGYQERWAEYRHEPSRITGLFKSTSAGNIDEWHLAQQFSAQPVLNTSFIEDTPPMSRVLAAGAAANGMQVLWDSVFKIKKTRPMPMFSVPGQMDRF